MAVGQRLFGGAGGVLHPGEKDLFGDGGGLYRGAPRPPGMGAAAGPGDPRRDEASLRYAGARAEELEKAAAGLRAGGAPGNLPQAERLEQAARKIREKMEDREG